MKAICHEIILLNKEINYNRIVCRMLSYSWKIALDDGLSLGKQDQLDIIVRNLNNKYLINLNLTEDELFSEFYKTINKNDINDIRKQLLKYVQYRLLTPFYSEQLRGKKDYDKNLLIFELSQQDNDSLYKIKDDKIVINQKWFDYIVDNKMTVMQWIDNNLSDYIESRNINLK